MSAHPSPTSSISTADRLAGAIWGQFVGDAAALGSHWIYDLDELEDQFPDGVQGFDAPGEGHYHAGKVPGDLTHYGDGALVLLRSLAAKGGFDLADYAERFFSTFGEGYTGYRDKATNGTIAKKKSWERSSPLLPYTNQHGADDDQPGTITRLAPLVVSACGEDEDGFLTTIATATRFLQDNAVAIAYSQAHAIVLRELFNGATPDEALDLASTVSPEIRDKVIAVRAVTNVEVVDATRDFGQACPLPNSFPAALHAFLVHADVEGFKPTILSILRAGGDSAARAGMAGAWLGAHLGQNAIPVAWKERLTAREEISRLTRLVTS
ncbi:ADP-ribosylglycohydrolase family protein [soil metagenome]